MILSTSLFQPIWSVVIPAILICVLVAGSATLLGGQIFAPWRMFLLSNVGGLGIAFLRMHPMMTPWAAETWIVWLLAILSYSVGAWSAQLVPIPKANLITSAQSANADRRIFIASCIPFFIAVAGGLLTLGTFPVFAKEPEVARASFAFYAPWSGWFFSSSMLVYLFGARVIAKGGRGVWIHHVLFWSVVLLQMLTGIRTPVLFGFFCLAYQWEIHRGRIPILKIAAGVFLFLVLFIAVALLRQGDAMNFAREIPISTVAAVIVGPPYIYIANNFWNLDHGITQIAMGLGHPSTWGLSSTQGIWDMFGVGMELTRSFGFDTIYNERSSKETSLNTFGFIWPLFKDGGIPFVTIVSLIWGGVAELLHKMAQRLKHPTALTLSPFVAFASLLSFFMFHFFVGAFLVFMLIALLIAMAQGVRSSKSATATRAVHPEESPSPL